ncbi:hypothetical protein JR316_0010200 [Psilocybe cubensis]|uniref:Uncharacterized protein n=1 Tax=Psilocybe cubensis TaxID=181762 RepID=A0ACB8GRB6_PSICU|nr:hypothetical protein JR316_0010200 [Psilocybe cubensis]KAH9477967.1 hypothetical protein JR316_0010200 [Psilocybe cubensis]
MAPLHLSTILAHTPSALLSQISRISSKYGGRGHAILFTLSNNFEAASELQSVVDGLTSLSNCGEDKGRTLGCLVDSISSMRLPASNSSQKSNNPEYTNNILSCSIGVFDSSRCVPFYSELRGRTQPQVGRWHAFRKKNVHNGDPNSIFNIKDSDTNEWEPDWALTSMNGEQKAGQVNWEDIWSRSISNTSSTSELLPDSLRDIDHTKIKTVLSLSNVNPDTLTHVLHDSLPQASALTVIASPTHFTTGRPVTLFLDGKIHGEGAVGLAFLDDDMKNRTEFIGVKALSKPMTITSREGNMVNELDSSNPTKLLIASLDSAGLSPSSQLGTSSSVRHFKDGEQFALGVLSADGNLTSTYRITAGDPSSRGGSLSLDAHAAPEVGTIVQSSEHGSDFVRVIENAFIVPSTQGFVFSSALHPMWTCSLPGGSVALEWI